MSLVDELAKLDELHRSGALSEAEFAQAKAALLGGAPAGAALGSQRELKGQLAGQLAEVKYQNELAQIDREWEIERQQYLLRNRYGMAQVPTTGMAIGTAVVGGVFGLIWTMLAVSIVGGFPDGEGFSGGKVLFPLFGVVFIAAAIGYGLYAYGRAQKYDQAFHAYRTRRSRVQSDQAAGADALRDNGLGAGP